MPFGIEVLFILLLWSTISFLFLMIDMDHNNIVGPLLIKKSMSVGNMIRFVLCLPVSIAANLICTNAFSCFWRSIKKVLSATPFDRE
jgi:hypothetical protein